MQQVQQVEEQVDDVQVQADGQVQGLFPVVAGAAGEAVEVEHQVADEDGAADAAKRAKGEPHKRAMLLLTRRISATRRRDADLAYRDPAHLLADLRVVQDSLVAAGAPRQAYGHLQQLIWQVETFGFHLAELEVRQHSAVHAKVLAECIAARDEGAALSTQAEEVLDVFRTIAQIQHRYGPGAAGRYIVSFTQSAADLAAVHELARFAAGPGGTVPVLDVIPLFETFADLQAAPAIMAEIIDHPDFAKWLVEEGIETISLNPDTVVETWLYLAKEAKAK